MKKAGLFIIVLLIITQNICAQNTDSVSLDSLFEGGEKRFYGLLGKTMRIPDFARKAEHSGKVFMLVQISNEGTLDSVRVLKSAGYDLDDEATLLLSLTEGMWKSSENGPHRLTIPLSFKVTLTGKKDKNSDKKFEKYKNSSAYPYTKSSYRKERKAKADKAFQELKTADDYDRGVKLAQEEKFAEAKPLFEQMLRVNPQHPMAKINLGVCFYNLGDKEKACSLWKEVQQAGFPDADVYLQKVCK